MIVKGSSTCVFVVIFQFYLLLAVGKVTDPSEVLALKAIRSGLNDQMEHLLSWKNGDPCKSNWTGVVCDAAENYLHVIELHMMNLNLSGKLVPELGQLTHLQILNFMWNDLTGTIPKDISNLTSLRLLLLNGNKLSGSLPEELGYLSELKRLQIDQNEISGRIPKSLSNLKSIKHLHFNNNSLSGQIPSELCNLSYLHHLLIDNNLLSGYLPPEISQLPELRILQLDNNNFSGANIPTAYGNFSKLVKLSLRNCSLQGAIPDLSVVTNLSYLDLSWNSLSGSIPSNKYSDKMTTIDLSYNQISGSIPESFSHLPSLQKLSLANNRLSGSFPTEILQSRSLNSSGKLLIDLQNNMLSSISSHLNPQENVTLRLLGNPICNSTAIKNIKQFCRPRAGIEEVPDNATNSTSICPAQSCPTDDYFEYVPDSPLPCFCAAPLRIGYRLKSPSFSYFLPYRYSFKSYKTSALSLNLYQLSIDSSFWEKGPRLRMYLKLYPVSGVSIFNTSEVLRIRQRFVSWDFDGNDFFGPYELLNFTLLGPYSHLAFDPRGEGINKGVVIATVVVAVASSVILSAITAILIIRRHNRQRQLRCSKRSSSKLSMKIDGIKSFTLKEMALATNDFDLEVGQGGYGTVYKGILTDNTVVAIKRAKEGSVQGEKEFLTEIELLSRLHHRNLVALLGYCDEGGEQMLVYEFMPNGTLRDWLSAKSKEILNFGARLHIALGAAKGILYLHTEANPPIFHRDVKANNILLDSNFIAKVADFGLSRLVPYVDDQGNEPDHISTVVKGTPGYVDPEYFLTRQLTDKSDVYSFGVVLLETLTGLHPIYRGKNIVREVNLAHQSGELCTMIDSKMGSYPPTCVERFASLALWCCQDKPERRPSMLEVVRELEDCVHMMSDFETDSADSKSKFLSESILASPDTGRDFHQESHRSGDFISGITLTPR